MRDELPDVMFELFKFEFLFTEPKAEALANRVILFIKSGKLLHEQKLPTLAQVHELTGFSTDTVARAWERLKSKRYIKTVAGAHVKVNYPAGSFSNTDATQIQYYLDQYCIPSKGAYEEYETKIQKFIDNYKNGIFYRAPDVINFQLISIIRNRLNHTYNTAYLNEQIYYLENNQFALQMIGLVLHQEDGVIVVIGNESYEIKQAFEASNIKVILMNSNDRENLLADLAGICSREIVVGVLISIHAGFPNPNRISLKLSEGIIKLREFHQFTIIGLDYSSHWQDKPEDHLFKLLNIEQDGMIYLRPISNLNQKFYQMMELAASQSLIEKIAVVAKQYGRNNLEPVAAAAVEYLDSKLSRRLKRVALIKANVLGKIANQVLMATDFWEPSGITAQAWPGMYMVPKNGRLPEDAFEQLKELGILTVHPQEYMSAAIRRGFRIDLSIYIIKGNFESDMIRIEKVLRAICMSSKTYS